MGENIEEEVEEGTEEVNDEEEEKGCKQLWRGKCSEREFRGIYHAALHVFNSRWYF